MRIIFINVFKALLKLLYVLFNLFPVNEHKILFLSRQANAPSTDFQLIQRELKNINKEYIIINICYRVKRNVIGYSVFFWYIVKSMYHLATVKVCVLDSYWPPVSILKHKRSLTVIQIWHSIGKIKKSGYQTLGAPGGRDEKISRALCMHQNYDIIIAGAKVWNPYYCESFGVTEDKLYNYGLPRIDFLINTNEDNKTKVYEKFPEFKNKPVILYAPTFRRNTEVKYDELISKFNFEKYILIIKKHPNDNTRLINQRIYTCDDFQSLEILSVCNYLITDYSAIAIEGAVLDIKTYYYVYDYEEYIKDNNINIDLFTEMPGCVFRNIEDILESIEANNYNLDAFIEYKHKYLPNTMRYSAKLIADMITEKMHYNETKQMLVEQK